MRRAIGGLGVLLALAVLGATASWPAAAPQPKVGHPGREALLEKARLNPVRVVVRPRVPGWSKHHYMRVPLAALGALLTDPEIESIREEVDDTLPAR